jgi:transposase
LRLLLRNDQWEPIKDLLPSRQGDPGVTARDNRLFVEAVLWIEHTGAPWRDLPREFGKWHTVYMRFHRLTKKGVWKQIVERLCGEADLEKFIPDSTVVRVHQHGARARKKNRRPAGHRALLRGADDEIPCGHRHLQAPALLEGFSPKRVIDDRAYDADSFIGKV